jgi:3-oxoacyl-[acyl-carrier-protein] synthase-3
VGHFVPEQIVSNEELTQYMDTSDEWITERTGIKTRRFFKEGEDTVSNMGTRAAQKAMKMAGKKPEDIDFIVFATLSPDYNFPGSGVLVQHQLGCGNIGALDVRAQCSGFVYGLSVADQYIKSGMYKTILVIGSEIQSNIFELSDRGRNMAVIFGDGAGAAVVEATNEEGMGILSTHLHSDGSEARELMLEHPGSRLKTRMTPEMLEDGSMLPYMNGNKVFKIAVTKFPEVISEALDTNGYKESDIDLLIPHQANIRIAQFVQKTMGLRDDQVYNNIDKYGNTTAASIPLAFSEAVEKGLAKPGDLVCFAAFGSGFTWASCLMKF